MQTDSIKNILETLLNDAYDMEEQITDALPDMIEAAENPSLVRALENHKTETEAQQDRLKQAMETLDTDQKDVTCNITKNLIEEGQTMIKGCKEGAVRDAAIIIAAQRIEHLEIATYGSMIALAQTLGEAQVANLLTETLKEEKDADQAMNALAETTINPEAAKKAA